MGAILCDLNIAIDNIAVTVNLRYIVQALLILLTDIVLELCCWNNGFEQDVLFQNSFFFFLT